MRPHFRAAGSLQRLFLLLFCNFICITKRCGFSIYDFQFSILNSEIGDRQYRRARSSVG
jgi:hypothetical protein